MRIKRVRQFLRKLSRYRSLRVTPEGTRFLLLTLGVGGAAINTGHNLLYLFFAMMLSLIVISGILSEQCLRQVDIRRHLPPHIFANRPATASFVIANRKARLSTFSLHVMDIISETAVDRGVRLLHLAPGGTVRQAYSLLVSRRGRFRLDGIKLLTRFPFGFFVKAAALPLQSEVLVYPQIRTLPTTLMHELAAHGQGVPILERGQGAGLHNLRLYQPGDDSRTIHWKTTARKTQLIVRETEAEHQQRVTLVLYNAVPGRKTRAKSDTTAAESTFEQAVTLTASLAHFFRQRAYHIRLLVGEHELPYGVGEAHFYRLLTLLALCESTDAPSAGVVQSLGGLTRSTYAIAILPVSDALALDLCRGVSRVLIASDLTWPA